MKIISLSSQNLGVQMRPFFVLGASQDAWTPFWLKACLHVANIANSLQLIIQLCHFFSFSSFLFFLSFFLFTFFLLRLLSFTLHFFLPTSNILWDQCPRSAILCSPGGCLSLGHLLRTWPPAILVKTTLRFSRRSETCVRDGQLSLVFDRHFANLFLVGGI